MALAYIYKRGAVWWMKYSPRTGLPRRSLNTHDKKLAEAIRINEEHRLTFMREGIKSGNIQRIKFSKLILDYIDHKKAKDLRPATLENYANALNRFGDSLQANITVDTITLEMVERHIREMKADGFAPKTIRNEVMALVTAFRWAAKMHYTSEAPTDGLELPKPIKYLPRPLRREQYIALQSKVNDENIRDIFDFYYLTGIRRADGPILTFSEHVDLKGRILYLPQQKQGNYRQMYISDELLPVVKRLKLRAGERDRLISVHKGDLSKAFRKAADAAKLPPHITFHSLRHSYGTMLAATGAPQRMVQVLMGHSDPRSTEIYVGAYDEDLRRAIKKLKLPLAESKN